jgi:hypothetical protein
MTTETNASPERFLPEDDDEWLRESLAPRRRWPRLTLVLAAAAVAAIAFMAGVLIEKNYFAGSSSGGAATGGGGFRRFAGLSGAGTTGASGSQLVSSVTIGQVKVINGKTIYVTDTTGNTVKVVLTASSRLTAQQQVKIKALHPGDTVTVRGAAGAGGTIQATTVAIGTSGGGFGGFRSGGSSVAGGGSAAGSG